ncbi:MAG TPA: SDR family oxidoreductase [Stellaceae bacterium]|nr:SDR family oxidoreductase [Stellaceae bacterium]
MSDVVDPGRQVAVVTGGGRGLGRAFARALAGAGAAVAVIARSAAELAETAALIERSGGVAHAFPADVTDASAITGCLAEIERRLGPVGLLVNNAGALGPLGPVAETDIADWWQALDVNLRGPVLCTRAVLPGMIARRHGRIVNVASGAGARAIAHFSAYVVSKTALLRFTECVAIETRPAGVAVFALGPGTVRTALAEHSLASPEGRTWLPWFRAIFDEGRDLPPERPARLLLALASGRYDALSGCYLTVFDDLDAILARADAVEREKLHVLRVDTAMKAP